MPRARACATARSDPQMMYSASGLDPEVRGIIRNVGQDGDKVRGGPRLAQALGEGAVEMGNHRDHQVGAAGAPELLEQPHRLRVQKADEKLQHPHGLRGAERPAFLQHQVVEVLHAQAR